MESSNVRTEAKVKAKAKKEKAACNINFTKFKDRSVKVLDGEKKIDGIEIIGQKGSYSIYTDPERKQFSDLRGRTGDLKEVKEMISTKLCGQEITSPSKEMGE